MSNLKNEIPEKAELTGEVEEVNCVNCKCSEWFLFSLKQGEREFTIGLLDILDCLRFAEEHGGVPPLSEDWWETIERHFYTEIL